MLQENSTMKLDYIECAIGIRNYNLRFNSFLKFNFVELASSVEFW